MNNHPNQDQLFRKIAEKYLRSMRLGEFDPIEPATHLPLTGKNVGVLIKHQQTLSQAICLLHGVAKRMLILPPDVIQDHLNHYIKNAEIECLVADSVQNAQVPQISPLTLAKMNLTANGNPSLIETEWLVCTSGTTSSPKIVKHTLNSLSATTKVGAGSNYKWGLLYRLERFAGLQVFMQAIFGGSKICFREDHETLSETLQKFSNFGVDCLSATPTMWRKLLIQPEHELLKLDQITLGGEIVTDDILKALKISYPNAKIRHIYASTEAGVGFSVTDGKSGFPASYLTNPPPGVSLRINPLTQILEIKRHEITTKYLGSSDDFRTPDGYVTTGDIVKLVNERIYFLGRSNGSLNVGGNKVFPEMVERTLLSYPGVIYASVSGKTSSFVGNLILAKIFISKSAHAETKQVNDLRREILHYCRSKLAPHEVPAIIEFLPEIPNSTSGKTERK